ncbi:MAG: hypothetical protein ABID04_00910 [Patescibacteria group bacterium]
MVKLPKVPRKIIYYLVLGLVWEIWLLFRSSNWIDFLLLPLGLTVGYLILEINWPFKGKAIEKQLPLLLLPLTIFILSSTPGVFEKGLIVCLNLRLFVDLLDKG